MAYLPVGLGNLVIAFEPNPGRSRTQDCREGAGAKKAIRDQSLVTNRFSLAHNSRAGLRGDERWAAWQRTALALLAGGPYGLRVIGSAAFGGNEWVAGIAQGLNVGRVSVADVRSSTRSG